MLYYVLLILLNAAAVWGLTSLGLPLGVCAVPVIISLIANVFWMAYTERALSDQFEQKLQSTEISDDNKERWGSIAQRYAFDALWRTTGVRAKQRRRGVAAAAVAVLLSGALMLGGSALITAGNAGLDAADQKLASGYENAWVNSFNHAWSSVAVQNGDRVQILEFKEIAGAPTATVAHEYQLLDGITSSTVTRRTERVMDPSAYILFTIVLLIFTAAAFPYRRPAKDLYLNRWVKTWKSTDFKQTAEAAIAAVASAPLGKKFPGYRRVILPAVFAAAAVACAAAVPPGFAATARYEAQQQARWTAVAEDYHLAPGTDLSDSSRVVYPGETAALGIRDRLEVATADGDVIKVIVVQRPDSTLILTDVPPTITGKTVPVRHR